jgi:hypothetical protein
MVKFTSIVAAAAVAIALAFQSGATSAQTQVGVNGADGYARAMWRGTDGSINLWKLDSVLNYVGSHVYGPYAGWSPIALNVIGSTTYILWTHTDGTANIWVVDANLNFVGSRTFGPVGGWEPYGLGNDYSGNLRLLWKTPANQVTAWIINPSLIVISGAPTYGPYFGWHL